MEPWSCFGSVNLSQLSPIHELEVENSRIAFRPSSGASLAPGLVGFAGLWFGPSALQLLGVAAPASGPGNALNFGGL